MEIKFNFDEPTEIHGWRVKEGQIVRLGHFILEYGDPGGPKSKFKSPSAGKVVKILQNKGSKINKGTTLMLLEECPHPTVMNDMCAECCTDLSKLEVSSKPTATQMVSMVHTVPGLKVSLEMAQKFGKEDEMRLLKQRRLALLVDLDQTVIHTTNDVVPPNLEDVFHFKLWHGSMWYHTRIRPFTKAFLENMSKLFELHICTFGSRGYAHTIAQHLDPEKHYFSSRILSRDECFSSHSKTANLKELFPQGDNMVCIIDDREDVWNFAPNLIHVKPYHFFRHTGDINAPPGLTKKDQDEKSGFDFSKEAEAAGLENKQSEEDKYTKKAQITVAEADSSSSTIATLPSPADEIEIKSNLMLSEDDDSKSSAQEEEKANEGDMDDDDDDDKKKNSTTITISTETTAKLKVDEVDEKEAEPKSLSNKDTDDELGLITPKKDYDEKPDEEEAGNEVKKDITTTITTTDDVNVNTTADNAPTTTDTITTKNENTCSNPETISTTTTSNDTTATNTTTNTDTNVKKEENVLKVEDSDDYLLYLEDILKGIHKAFYDLYDETMRRGDSNIPDVKNVIPYVRRKVLKGVNIVFSGVFPTSEKLEKSKAFKIATSLGANVTTNLIPPSSSTSKGVNATTHLIAARPGTVKVNEARRYKGIHIITPNWLWACNERWERSDERNYPLFSKKAGSVGHHGSSHHTQNQNEDENLTTTNPISQDSKKDSASPSSSGSTKQTPGSRKTRTPSGRFMDTINPLLSFSMDEIEKMGHEVDDICNESDESSSSSSTFEAQQQERPARRKRKSSIPTQEQQQQQQQKQQTPPQKDQQKDQDVLLTETNDSNSDSSSSSSSSDSDDSDSKDSSQEDNTYESRKRKRLTETETEEETIGAKFRRGEPLPSDLDGFNLTNDDSDDDGNNKEEEAWMAKELEREFLGDDENSSQLE